MPSAGRERPSGAPVEAATLRDRPATAGPTQVREQAEAAQRRYDEGSERGRYHCHGEPCEQVVTPVRPVGHDGDARSRLGSFLDDQDEPPLTSEVVGDVDVPGVRGALWASPANPRRLAPIGALDGAENLRLGDVLFGAGCVDGREAPHADHNGSNYPRRVGYRRRRTWPARGMAGRVARFHRHAPIIVALRAHRATLAEEEHGEEEKEAERFREAAAIGAASRVTRRWYGRR